jgi:hypothetical protein
MCAGILWKCSVALCGFYPSKVQEGARSTHMNIKKFATISILFAVVALLGGCHYDGHHRDYGNNRYGNYREGYRDGRAYERRNERWRDRHDDWRDHRYADRDYWRRRW